MILHPDLLSAPLAPVLGVAQLLLLAAALVRAPWTALRLASQRLHLLFGALLALLALWSVGGRIGAHASLHLLGMTTVTLLLGPALAILVGTAALAMMAALGAAPWSTVLANGLVTLSVPAAVTFALLVWATRHAPRNLFVFMLGVGFAGGALSMLAAMLMMLGLFATAGDVRALREWGSPLLLLAMFPEGFVNGAMVSSLAVYKPHWLRLYDDRHFLG